MPEYYEILTPAEIIYLRHTLGWSQRRLGAFLGITYATVQRWESGAYEPKPWAAALLYKLWLDVFGTYEGPYPELEDEPEHYGPQPAQSDEALRHLGALLLTGGIGYLVLKALSGDSEQSEDDD
ncbi:MAG: helix-turn-helix domain-containing protein [Bacteroidota bacterium]